jgi:hypothetical protein
MAIGKPAGCKIASNTIHSFIDTGDHICNDKLSNNVEPNGDVLDRISLNQQSIAELTVTAWIIPIGICILLAVFPIFNDIHTMKTAAMSRAMKKAHHGRSSGYARTVPRPAGFRTCQTQHTRNIPIAVNATNMAINHHCGT